VEKQNTTDVKLDDLSSVMAQLQEDMRLLVKQVDLEKRESESIQFKQESDQNPKKSDELRQRQEPTVKYENNMQSIERIKNYEIQNEILALKSKIQRLSDLQNKSMAPPKKEVDANELKTKIANLESTDVFLQETGRLVMEKTVRLEKTIDELRKVNSGIEKHQKNSIKTVDQLEGHISAEKLRVNSLEVFIKKCQEQKLEENSAVKNRIEVLDEGYRTILKETTCSNKTIEDLADITNELKNKANDVKSFNLTNYEDMFSKTESHEAKLEILEKNITDLQITSSNAQQLPNTPGGQIKT
jgi:hypothetical protein